MRDSERIARIQDALKRAQLDALVCALPDFVLMSTGYWPVVGTSLSVTNADGRQVVLAPKDEEDLARRGWAEVQTYHPSSLEKVQTVGEAALGPLRSVMEHLGIAGGRIGFERGPASEPASYVAMHLFGGSIVSLIHNAARQGALVPADDLLAALAAVKTPTEVGKIRIACQIAERAFEQGTPTLATGLTESEVAAGFRLPLMAYGIGYQDIARADGFAFCMSGPNSAQAYGAYARSRPRRIELGDLALIHCNSCADGYWTDITRTYCVGDPDDRILAIYEAVLAARNAALKTIGPGVGAKEVDQAAREKLERRGFGKAFKHPTGHGLGFAAISANARPRIHPKSEEVLEPGMVFNLEPAVYIEGFGGIRHCDMVAVTDSGVELLTPFHASLDDLLITSERLLKKSLEAA
jgi:Xaa-Pro aminopeptidase